MDRFGVVEEDEEEFKFGSFGDGLGDEFEFFCGVLLAIST